MHSQEARQSVDKFSWLSSSFPSFGGVLRSSGVVPYQHININATSPPFCCAKCLLSKGEPPLPLQRKEMKKTTKKTWQRTHASQPALHFTRHKSFMYKGLRQTIFICRRIELMIWSEYSGSLAVVRRIFTICGSAMWTGQAKSVNMFRIRTKHKNLE